MYQVTFLWVAWRWSGPARTIAIWLFAYRAVGFVAFEVSGERALLLAFPNVFEYWFLFVASLPHWRPGFAFSRGATAAWLAALTALKEFQ